MSRPSITKPPDSPSARCRATSARLTSGNFATAAAATSISGVRIASVTSSPSMTVRPFSNPKITRSVNFDNPASSSKATFSKLAFHATARYIAPVSTYWYPSLAATARATVPFPAPDGPSIAITVCASAIEPTQLILSCECDTSLARTNAAISELVKSLCLPTLREESRSGPICVRRRRITG